jgi:hypothetical protein
MATSSKTSNVNAIILILFLVLSVLSGLILSIWVLLNKTSGKGYIIQLVFGLVCIVLFGYVSYHFYMEGPGAGNQMIWYYFGMIGTYSNGLAALIWILTLFVKSNNI